MLFIRSFPCRVLIILVTTVGALFLTATVHAADLRLTPSTGSYSTGQTFTVTIQVVPGGDSINAVEAQLSFDSNLLSVVSVAKTGSVFTLWPVEPTFSNGAGTITFGGGHTAPITSNSTLLQVTFRATGEGDASVSFDSGSVLAADGRGTDVLNNTSGGTFTIGGATTPTPQDTPSEPGNEGGNEAITFGDPPRAPEVGSTEFLDPDLWYNRTEGLFTWELPFDVDEIAVEIATSSENEPSEIIDPPVEEFAVSSENLSDGIQYLSIQFKNQVGWGAITNRPIKIDTTPPKDFLIDVQTSNSATGFPLLVFEAEDATSGIAEYEVFVADKEPFTITPDEARLGYLLKELEDGTYTVSVIATDMAGNETESSVPVLITAGWSKEVEVEEKRSFRAFFTGVNLLIFFLLVIIVLLLTYLFYERKRWRIEEERLRKEVREIQDQMEKIFSALRDEIHDQIVTITKRPRLSKKEREAVEGLNQALEVSETLIEKEISDVKKILK
ncbi:hypothetical protein CL655_03495 [bacterium]|nr:hypothetical protein [bacterium]|tara:strand:+ start:4438 stop:5937 length:1500 start_codon:yes stop_codon:yes gene_type:complete